jgi:hypothetical protein
VGNVRGDEGSRWGRNAKGKKKGVSNYYSTFFFVDDRIAY